MKNLKNLIIKFLDQEISSIEMNRKIHLYLKICESCHKNVPHGILYCHSCGGKGTSVFTRTWKELLEGSYQDKSNEFLAQFIWHWILPEYDKNFDWKKASSNLKLFKDNNNDMFEIVKSAFDITRKLTQN